MPTTPTVFIDDIFAMFRAKGSDHYGEDVTQQEHAVQCAALAERDGMGDELVAAALLHDIGHLLHDDAQAAIDAGVDDTHEDLAERWLAGKFPASVTEPIRLHVAAKRYLTAVEPEYLGFLSEASRQSLMVQGGPMSQAEIAEFERNPHFEAAVQLRRYDDLGKDTTLSAIDPERFRGAVERVALG